MSEYTWKELYDRNLDFRAKDEAREQLCDIARGMGIDFSLEEVPEETISDFCDKHKIKFDERGNISFFHKLEWNDLSDDVKGIVEWVRHPFNGKEEVVNIKVGEDFYRNYKDSLTSSYKNKYPFDTGELRIPVTRDIYDTVLDYISEDDDLRAVIDEESESVYFGFRDIMKNFSLEEEIKNTEIPDNEIDLDI